MENTSQYRGMTPYPKFAIRYRQGIALLIWALAATAATACITDDMNGHIYVNEHGEVRRHAILYIYIRVLCWLNRHSHERGSGVVYIISH